MFSKKYRLPLNTKSGFQKTISTPYFLIKTSINNIGHNRLGVIISNTSVKKSNHRHFWKRRFSEHIRRWPNMGRDFLVIASPKIEHISAKDLHGELISVFKKITLNS